MKCMPGQHFNFYFGILKNQAANHIQDSRSSGYLNFITGDQDPKHLRFYVSQPNNLRWRIQQHTHAVRNGDQSSLHYYIIANCEGDRVAVFIQLGSSTVSEGINDTRKAKYSLRTTILTRSTPRTSQTSLSMKRKDLHKRK